MGVDYFEEIRDLNRQKAKGAMGGFSTFVWIGSGIYLYWTTAGVSFLSLSALGFFILGMFVAALVFGNALYLSTSFFALIGDKIIPAPTPAMGKVIQIFSAAIALAWAVVIYLCANWIFHWIEGL